MFGFLPPSIWTTLLAPKWLAIFLWCLSTGQLIKPMLVAVPSEQQKNVFPARDAACLKVNASSPRKLSSDFVPEEYCHDFMTYWSTIVQDLFEMWSFTVDKSTYRQSVANLALASGLRYTGSMSISHPKQQIQEIIEAKQGYTVDTGSGLNPLPQGWEMRALQEFQVLGKTHLNRITFVMLYKLAFQMNLQITYVIISRINLKRQHQSAWGISVLGLVSVMSMLYTFCTELYDVYGVTSIFRKVNNARSGAEGVRKKAFRLGTSSKPYAINDFYDEDGTIARTTYSGRDFKQAYFAAARTFWKLILMTIFCVWLILYALLKFFFAFHCPSGAWELHSGCLTLHSDGPVAN